MGKTIPFIQYVFKRLQRLNCHSIHGVPGDFFLRALDHTTPRGKPGVNWIGNASELCAGYAADGYARAGGQIARHRSLPFAPTVGALLTTYGVGELSAINAVAGSYAESIPVVHLVGTPSRKAMAKADRHRPIHHSPAGENMEAWADMAKYVTCAQAHLHRQENIGAAAEMLDDVLEQAVRRSKPVYASIPSDMIDAEISADMLQKPLLLDPPQNDVKTEELLLKMLVKKIQSARSLLIVADGLSYPFQLSKEINSLVEMTGIRAMSYTSGKGVIEENLPSWDPALPNTTEESQNADFVMYFGPLLADTNTARWSAIPQAHSNVLFNLETVEVDGQSSNVRSKPLLEKLVEMLARESWEKRTEVQTRKDGKTIGSTVSSSRAHDKITQDSFWTRMSHCLQPHDTLLFANGTPLIGGRELHLKPHSTVVASSIWCSIGHMLPAAQGIAAAKADHGLPGRTILFEGDGSFQVTCQSISDILRNKLDVTVFLVNNSGYTYERWLNGMRAEFNDVPSWRYSEAGKFFGGGEDAVVSKRIEDFGQLMQLVEEEKHSDWKGLRIYDIIMDPEDVPEKSKAGLLKASEALRSS